MINECKLSFSDSNNDKIKDLFNKVLDSLQIASGKIRGRKKPVSVAKAIHLLAPKFFPRWDDKIAWAYGGYYSDNLAEKYVLFLLDWIFLLNQAEQQGFNSRAK